MSKPCIWCESLEHTSFYCKRKINKPIARSTKRIKQKGRRTMEYEEWRDNVAKPYLDETFGHVCVTCGMGDYGMHTLDVEHKLNRGSHANLKMDLNNVQWMGNYPCHFNKTNRIKG